MSGDSEVKHKSKTHLSEICGTCGKPKRALRSGSLTSWLFKLETCICQIASASETEQPITVTSESRREQRRQKASVKAGSELQLGGRFKILEKIGDGGMGTVYKVHDESIDRIFAVKVLNPLFARDFSKKRRFIREIKALERLDHPNIVSVYGYGEATNGLPFMVMEYIDGITLAEKLKDSSFLPEHQALPIFEAICEALADAHAQGFVHRDLKPSNIMLIEKPDGTFNVKVVDFGISKLRQEGLNRTTNLTQTGEIFGSPYYMSPEQCHGEEIDRRSDIYSLGCLMYETLTGKPPFFGGNPVGVIMSHLNDKPLSFKRSNPLAIVKPLTEAVVMQCLEKQPQKRFQSMQELSTALKTADSATTASATFAGSDFFKNVTTKPAIIALLAILGFECVILLGGNRLPWQAVPRFLGIKNSVALTTKNGIVFTGSDKASTTEDAFNELARNRGTVADFRVQSLDLTGKRYTGISFVGAEITNSHFQDAEFENCDFTQTTFRKCDFTGATFRNCRFYLTHLDTCNFTSTYFQNTPLTASVPVRCIYSNASFDKNWNDDEFGQR